jgi:hypothetical protein
MNVQGKNVLFAVSCAAHLQDTLFIINVNLCIIHQTGPVCYSHLTRGYKMLQAVLQQHLVLKAVCLLD